MVQLIEEPLGKDYDMTDYEALDLHRYCNAGKKALRLSDPRLGDQVWRGLPFRVAEDPERCCIVPAGAPVRIEVGGPASCDLRPQAVDRACKRRRRAGK